MYNGWRLSKALWELNKRKFEYSVLRRYHVTDVCKRLFNFKLRSRSFFCVPAILDVTMQNQIKWNVDFQALREFVLTLCTFVNSLFGALLAIDSFEKTIKWFILLSLTLEEHCICNRFLNANYFPTINKFLKDACSTDMIHFTSVLYSGTKSSPI